MPQAEIQDPGLQVLTRAAGRRYSGGPLTSLDSMSTPEFHPIFFAAVVTVKNGDARIMCMAQQSDDQAASIHYIKVDTSLDDSIFNFRTGDRRTFQEDLRGAGLAVRVVERAVPDLQKLVEADLREAYGSSAEVAAKQISRPSLASLFI